MTTECHDTTISCEQPSSSCGGVLVLQGGHRARCSCGWHSDCYAQLMDTERAVEVHLRRSRAADFDALIARSSIGRALTDAKDRGWAAHLKDLEREMPSRRRAKQRATKR